MKKSITALVVVILSCTASGAHARACIAYSDLNFGRNGSVFRLRSGESAQVARDLAFLGSVRINARRNCRFSVDNERGQEVYSTTNSNRDIRRDFGNFGGRIFTYSCQCS